MVKEYKGTTTLLSGKGKHTEKVINSLQNFYGIAIRQNSGNLYEMKKAVEAILWHCRDMKDIEVRHQFYSKGESSWCKYQRDKTTGEKTYKTNLNIQKWIHDIIKPVFIELSSDNFIKMSKCLHGRTQNSNESLHSVIWVKCPQNVFLERQTLEIGVYYAAIEFNESCQGIHKSYRIYGA